MALVGCVKNFMKKKKVLLLNPPSPKGDLIIKDQYCSFTSKAGYYWIPIDLLVLSGDLNHHFELKVIDAIVEGLDKAEVISIVTSFSPDHIVVLSSILTHSDDRSLIADLRKYLNFKTTFLGDVFYFNSKEMIEFEEVDSIIYEYPCPELVDYIKEGRASYNIMYREGSSVIVTPGRKETEVHYHTPAHHLFKLKLYSVPFKQDEMCSSVLTNFGCKYTCNYCPADSVSFRERSIFDIVEEIKILKSNGISNIWIRDFTFGLNKKRTEDLLNELSILNIRWFCLSRSEIMHEQLMKSMAEAGCYLIMMGVDSSSKETMKRINRKQDITDIKRKIKVASNKGMYVLVHMILGFPGDRLRDMLCTIHFIARTQASFVSINFFSPRSGSAYFKQESIQVLNAKVLDSNFASQNGTAVEFIKLNLLKYYALIIFYFNPVRTYSILQKIKSKTQFAMLVKTGIKMFFPVAK